ncbi:MAG: dihydrofolate reductase family protein [Micromonosporaceae bacterium]
MRKLHVATLVTLDGVTQDPGGFGETAQGGWAGRHFDAEAVRHAVDKLATVEVFLCGRVTYQLLSKAWSGNSGEYAEAINRMPKPVASTTLRAPLDWNATLIDGDVAGRIAALKRQPGGDIMVYGSATLFDTLLRHGLVDTYQVSVFPLTLGGGRRLFPDGTAETTFGLAAVEPLRSGIVILTYRPNGS